MLLWWGDTDQVTLASREVVVRVSPLAILGTGAVAVVAVALLLFAQSRQTATSSPQAWSAFSARYRVMAPEQLDRDKDLFQVWLLEYRSKRDWSQTLLSDDAYPSRAGSTEQFDGDVLVKYNALANTTTRLPNEGNALAVPHRWLVPLRIDDYVERGFAVDVPQADGAVRLSRDETFTCTAGERVGESACPPDGVISGRTEVDLGPDGVPRRVVERVGERSIAAFTVLELSPLP